MERYGTYIFYALLFTTVVLLVEGLYLFLRYRSPAEKAANERMKLIEKTNDDGIGITLLRKQQKKPGSTRITNHLQGILWAANAKMPLTGFFLMIIAFSVILMTILVFVAGWSPVLGVPFGLIFGIVLPYLFIRLRAAQRQALFADQLVPAIDLVSRGLQAGHPAAVALEIVSKEMPDPVGTEFGLAIDEIAFGLDRNVALQNIGRRFPSPDLKFFVSAMEVQRETGGNLVEVLNNLTSVMRARQGMRKKIKAMSSEGRFTALVVGILPIFMFLIISALNPTYYSQHYGDPAFTFGMAIPFTLYLLGMYWIWKMINIRI